MLKTAGHRHQMQVAVRDPRLRQYGIGKRLNPVGASTQDHGLDAMFVVQVRLHRSHGEVMVILLHVLQAHGQLPVLVGVKECQCGHAGPVRSLGPAHLSEIVPQQVSKCFRAVLVAALVHQLVECLCKFVIHRHRQAPHPLPLPGLPRPRKLIVCRVRMNHRRPGH